MTIRRRKLGRCPLSPARSPLGRALVPCLTITLHCLVAIGCKAAIPPLPNTTGRPTTPAETPDRPAAPSSSNSTAAAPPQATPEIGDDIARLLKNPPALGQAIEIVAYTYHFDVVTMNSNPGLPSPNLPEGHLHPLTDGPYFHQQDWLNVLVSTSPSRVANLPWIWAVGEIPDLELGEWHDRPVRYRLRGHLGKYVASSGEAPATVFFVDEILSQRPIACLPGDCESKLDRGDWSRYRDEATGISLPLPSGWTIREKDSSRTQFIDPYRPDWPIELERRNEPIDTRTNRQLDEGESWAIWRWVNLSAEDRPAEPKPLEGNRIICEGSVPEQQTRNRDFCMGVGYTWQGRSWILRMHFPRVYGASPGQIRYFKAIRDGVRIEGWPTITPAPTPSSTPEPMPLILAGEARRRAKASTAGGPWQVDKSVLVSEADAVASDLCKIDLPDGPYDPRRVGAAAGIWVVYLHGPERSGKVERLVTYINAITGDRSCAVLGDETSWERPIVAAPTETPRYRPNTSRTASQTAPSRTPSADPRPPDGAPEPDSSLSIQLLLQVHESRWKTTDARGWQLHEEQVLSTMLYNRSTERLDGLVLDFGLPEGSSMVEAIRLPRGAQLLAGAGAPKIRLPSLPGGSAMGPVVLLVDQLPQPARVSVRVGEAWLTAGPSLRQGWMAAAEALSGFPGQGSQVAAAPDRPRHRGMGTKGILPSDDFPNVAGMRWCMIEKLDFGTGPADHLRHTTCPDLLRPAAVVEVYFQPLSKPDGQAPWQRLADTGNVGPDGRTILYRVTESGYYATGVRNETEESGLFETDPQLFADLVAAISRAATEDPAYSAIGHPAVIMHALELAGDAATSDTILRFQLQSRPALICRASGCVTGDPDTRIVDAGDGSTLLDERGSPGPAADATRVRTGFGYALPDVVRIGTVSGRARIVLEADPAKHFGMNPSARPGRTCPSRALASIILPFQSERKHP